MVSMVDFLYDIVLDYQGIDIYWVTNILDEDLYYQVEPESEELGGELRIFVNSPLMKSKSIDIVIYY